MIVPDAERYFVVGMMTLSQALLRDLRILCSNDDLGASQIFDDVVRSNLGDVTKLLLSDVSFARQVCESAYVVSQYEALHTTELLHRLSAAGFRAVHVYDPALQRPRSGRLLMKQNSVKLPRCLLLLLHLVQRLFALVFEHPTLYIAGARFAAHKRRWRHGGAGIHRRAICRQHDASKVARFNPSKST